MDETPKEPAASDLLQAASARRRREYRDRLYWRLKDWRDGRGCDPLIALDGSLDRDLFALANAIVAWHRDDLMADLLRLMGPSGGAPQ